MTEKLTIRLTGRDKSSIKLLVKQGKYINMSDFVRQSIRAMLNVERGRQ